MYPFSDSLEMNEEIDKLDKSNSFDKLAPRPPDVELNFLRQ